MASEPPASPASSLDSILATIRTATDKSLDEAIAEGVALTGYPYTDSSKPIPLAEELTPDQRRLMEAIATRSGLDFQTVRKFRIPDPVQVRRRWLGMDPPGVLEKIVNVPDESGEGMVAMPLWRALGRCVPLSPRGALGSRLVVDAFERLRLAVEAHEGRDAPYEILHDDGALADRAHPFAADHPAIVWARARLEELVAAWCEPGEAGPLALRPPGDSGPGIERREVTGVRRVGEVLRLLLATLVRADARFVVPPRFETLITLYEPHVLDLVRALPSERRDGVLVRAFLEARWHRVASAMAVLPAFPSRALATSVVACLESHDYRIEQGPAVVAAEQRAWAALCARLPAGIARTVASDAIVHTAAAPPADPVPAAPSPGFLGLPAVAMASAALADTQTFACLSEADRHRVAQVVAAQLGDEFEACATLVGDRGLASVRHVRSGYEFVLLPGEVLTIGLGEDEVGELVRAYGDSAEARLVAPFVRRWFPRGLGTRTVRVGPVAFGRDLLSDAHAASLGWDVPVSKVGASSFADLAEGHGFSLPTELEWEQAARDGAGASYLCDAARVWFEGCPAPEESRAGVRDLDRGEWTFATEGSAPEVGPVLAPGNDGRFVLRGVFEAYDPAEAGDVLTALVALRAAGRPLDGPNQRAPFVRMVIRLSETQGRTARPSAV